MHLFYPKTTFEETKTMPDWTNNVVKKINLNTFREWKELNLSDNEATIMPYEHFNASKQPVLLIHGVGTPGILKSLASRLDGAGLQVLFVFYDDLGQEAHLNGRQIAKRLNEIRVAHYPDAAERELDIVAHSLGGVVARCAINCLQTPNWRKDDGPNVGSPRAGFEKIRLRTIDTPWSGFGSNDPEDYDPNSEGYQTIVSIMTKLGFGGGVAMAAGSQTMTYLYQVPLTGVDLQNLIAYRPGKKDWVKSLPECKPNPARDVARCLAFNEVPTKLLRKNLCFGLRQDSRYPALRQALHRAIIEMTIDLEKEADQGLVKELTRIHDSVMPRFVGSHIGVALDKEDDAHDLVDYLVSELSS